MATDWNQFFMGMARYMATASKDPSTQVGAVIVDYRRIVVGMGYNGFPRGVRDDDARYADRSIKYKLIVHAEANAILNASAAVKGCSLYCTWHPCSDCTKLIVQAGISMVFCPAPDPRWAEDAAFARMMLEEGSVRIEVAP